MMLEPGSRHLLIDALRPPAGFTLDMAVGTTFTLDLLSLMTTPVAFAMFDRQDRDGSTIEDPIALLQALRDHASRITIFCQAGMISVPPQFRSLLVYLEESVYPVMPPSSSGIFHPKVWYIRYRNPDDGRLAYRLLCLSRNLTFDRSWDTVLRLDGVPGNGTSRPELARFAASLVRMAEPTRPMSDERKNAILTLGEQFSSIDWALPDGFERVRFWPLGDDGVSRWPFADVDGRGDRMLVISPFVTPDMLSRLTRRRKGSILLTRPETLDALGKQATSHLAERLVLSSHAVPAEEEDEREDREPAASDTATHEGHGLVGLHAKTYVMDAGWDAHVWTGSANATWPGFHSNVEFLVQLTGKKKRCGVHAAIGDHADRLGLRKLVEPYTPAQDEATESTEEEKRQWRLESLGRAIGSWRYSALCTPQGDDLWNLDVQGNARDPVDAARFDDVAITIRPATRSVDSKVIPTIDGMSLSTSFTVSEATVTPFFVVSLTSGDAGTAFLVVAALENAPEGRKEQVLTNLLRKPADLIRLLLLLLGNIDDALAYVAGAGGGGVGPGNPGLPFTSEALLEPLVRAFARDPDRLHDIERLLDDLRQSPEGLAVLPDGWDEIWTPISTAIGKGQANGH
jgi:hypothetical protein